MGRTRLSNVTVAVSETMRLDPTGDPVLGVWEETQRRIVIRRDQISSLANFASTLLHELGHMISGTADGTLAFEDEFTWLLGLTATAALARPNKMGPRITSGDQLSPTSVAHSWILHDATRTVCGRSGRAKVRQLRGSGRKIVYVP
jgi:hypothetical protein